MGTTFIYLGDKWKPFYSDGGFSREGTAPAKMCVKADYYYYYSNSFVTFSTSFVTPLDVHNV